MQHKLFQPVTGIFEGFFICDIENHTCSFRKIEIIVYDGSISLLTSRVPEFQVKSLTFIGNFFKTIVNSNGRFLWIKLAFNIPEQQSTLANCRSTNNDGLEVLYALLLISHSIQLLNLSLSILSNLNFLTFITIFKLMITYQFSPFKPIILSLIVIATIVILTIFLHHYSHFLPLLTFLLIVAILRCLGTFLMYPCSFQFTKSELQIRETENLLMCLHGSLLDLQSIVQKIMHWDLETLKCQKHWIMLSKLHQDLNVYGRVIEKSAQNSDEKNIHQLSSTFYRFNEKLNQPIESDLNPDISISFWKLLIDMNEIYQIKTDNKFRILQQVAYQLKVLGAQIWNLASNSVPKCYFQRRNDQLSLNKSQNKFQIGNWQIFAQKLFKINSFYAYWDSLFNYQKFTVRTTDGKVLQCAIILNNKHSQYPTSEKTVLFCSPNGALLQSCALSSSYIRFYLKNGIKVILWNYRGYGNSTGIPSIKRSTLDSQLIYHQAHKRFLVKIEIVHGYSIGGPCAIYLANKYSPSIKLLVADRTFSSIDRVPFGFIDHNLNYCKKPIKLLIQKLTKTLFYSDCIQNQSLYCETTCQKICIWANYDQIIYNNSSLKRGLFKKLVQVKSRKKQNMQSSNNNNIQSQNSSMKISQQTQKNSIHLSNRQLTSMQSDFILKNDVYDIIKMKNKFSQTMVNMYSMNPTVYRRFASQLRDIEGGGIRIPIAIEIQLKQFEQLHKQYYIGLICFSPTSSEDPSRIMNQLTQCATKIRQQISLMADKEQTQNLGNLVQTIQFVHGIMKKYHNHLKSQFGYLISTYSGHNGELQGQYNRLQKIMKYALGL